MTDHGLNFAEVIVNTVPRGGPTTEASLLSISNDMQDVIFSNSRDLMCFEEECWSKVLVQRGKEIDETIPIPAPDQCPSNFPWAYNEVGEHK